MTETARTVLSAILCAMVLGCAERPPPATPTVLEPEPVEIPEALPADPANAVSEAATSTTQSPDGQDVEPMQFVVYFGAFRDYRAAATYAESLRSAGLLQAKITRATGGRDIVVTDPMDEADARRLAESLRGRVLSVESLESMTEKALVIPGR